MNYRCYGESSIVVALLLYRFPIQIQPFSASSSFSAEHRGTVHFLMAASSRNTSVLVFNYVLPLRIKYLSQYFSTCDIYQAFDQRAPSSTTLSSRQHSNSTLFQNILYRQLLKKTTWALFVIIGGRHATGWAERSGIHCSGLTACRPLARVTAHIETETVFRQPVFWLVTWSAQCQQCCIINCCCDSASCLPYRTNGWRTQLPFPPPSCSSI